ncbi:SRPBCC domain-containing protein [Paenibacillus senegalensis]|uniref:SRPBCC domain-containing protein n=1 Tax=Paenibacillus senegalensis TaxID=1465766 RepID=UPI000287F03F|nr:SRPBCC domain-containing protein [Paenibacillus senegalensis]
MRNKTIVTKNPERRELIVERTVSVSAQLAWKGWTRPEHIERWWGPSGWTAVVHEMNVRINGIWRYSMSPDHGAGETVRCIATYHEVTVPS